MLVYETFLIDNYFRHRHPRRWEFCLNTMNCFALPPRCASFIMTKASTREVMAPPRSLPPNSSHKNSPIRPEPMSRIDLHLHTTHSDGSFNTSDVMTFAKGAGVTALAITDHDIVDGIPEAIAAGALLNIEVIPGVEISSRFGESELHILGYFLDWKDQTLNQRMTKLRDSRHARNPQIVHKLNELGVDLTYEEVRRLAGTESVGRPHIARVLMNKGVVTSAKEAFDRYLADGKPAYVRENSLHPKRLLPGSAKRAEFPY